MTMTLVSTVVVGAGGTGSVIFTGIPQTGQDLMVMLSIRGSASTSNSNLNMVFNSVTTGYSDRTLTGYGSAGVDSTASTVNGIFLGYVTSSDYTASTFDNRSIYVPNYAGSSNKSVSHDGVEENNATTARQNITAGLWANTAAITSVTFSMSNGTFVAGTTASLYTISTTGATGATVA